MVDSFFNQVFKVFDSITRRKVHTMLEGDASAHETTVTTLSGSRQKLELCSVAQLYTMLAEKAGVIINGPSGLQIFVPKSSVTYQSLLDKRVVRLAWASGVVSKCF